MKKITTLLIPFLMSVAMLNAQVRFLDPVFTEVTVTSNVEYATNISVLTGAPSPLILKMDVYEPTGDNLDLRPVVLVAHTGNFLPIVFNGGPFGTKVDSANVEMCRQLALRGYVAVSFEYRLGWNPLPTATDDVRRSTLLQAAYRGIQDARTVIRYLRKSVAEDLNPFGIDETKIVVGGMGTGGYISLGAAYLDKPEEINLLKFINLNTTPPQPYVIPAIFGNYEGSDTTFLPALDTAGNPISILFNIGNHPSYSSDFNMVFHMGGALGDESWIEDGDMPVVSFHSPQDVFAPYDVGNVIVPTTGDIVIPDAAGGLRVLTKANGFGNNQIFIDANFDDPVSQSTNSTLEGLYAFNALPARPDTQCVTSIPGYPISSGDPDAGPWNWYSPAAFIATWDFLNGQPGNPITGTEANCAALRGNLNSAERSKLFIDTVMQYLCPRMALVLEIGPFNSIEDDVLRENLRVYPNPVQGLLTVETQDAARPITQVTLYDLTGRMVRSQANLRTSHVEMNVSSLPQGIYVLRVQAGEGQFTQRIVVE